MPLANSRWPHRFIAPIGVAALFSFLVGPSAFLSTSRVTSAMSLGKLLQGSSPARPTYVLATVQSDFRAKDGSTELTVYAGDDLYLMFNIEGWAFATDLRDGTRKGYVPLSYCEAVEDYYVPTDDAPKTSISASGAVSRKVGKDGGRARACRSASHSDPAQKLCSAEVKTSQVRSFATSRKHSPAFDGISTCSSLEVSEIEADAELPCPSISSPYFGNGDSGVEKHLVERIKSVEIIERSAFRRPIEEDRPAVEHSPLSGCGETSCRPSRYQKFSSKFSRTRFSAAELPASAPGDNHSPSYLKLSAAETDGGGRHSTADEGYSSLVKYADTDAWRDHDADSYDVFSSCSVDYDSL